MAVWSNPVLVRPVEHVSARESTPNYLIHRQQRFQRTFTDLPTTSHRSDVGQVGRQRGDGERGAADAVVTGQADVSPFFRSEVESVLLTVQWQQSTQVGQLGAVGTGVGNPVLHVQGHVAEDEPDVQTTVGDQ
ncbi:hypothetical protein D3C78_646460 [compost metagenome]